MDDNLITKDNERVKSFFKTLDRMLDRIERSLTNSKPTLNGERFLTDKEVYQRLRVSRSTLQEWRYSGQLPYIQDTFQGKRHSGNAR